MELRIRDASGERGMQVSRRVATLGSAAECQVQLFAAGVSAVCALLYRDPQGYSLSLSDEQVRLLINDAPCQTQRLCAGDIIRLGEAEVHVVSLAESVQLAPAEGPGLDTALEATPASYSDRQGAGSSRPVAESLLRQLEAFSQSVLAQEAWPRPAEILLDSLLQVTCAEHGFLVLAHGDRLHIAAARLVGGERADQAALLSDSIVQQVLRSGQMVLLDDASVDPLFAAAPSVHQFQLRSVVCLPLRYGRHLEGALYLGARGKPGLFTPQALSLTRILAGQAAMLLASAQHVEELHRSVRELRQGLDRAFQ
jgi:hypothetical protein